MLGGSFRETPISFARWPDALALSSVSARLTGDNRVAAPYC